MNGFPFPNMPIVADFSSGNYLDLYRWVMDNVGILDSDAEFAVTPEAFKKGLFFIPFDLSPTGVSCY